MSIDQVASPEAPESRLAGEESSDSLLLQIRSDRRLGHEWDDWDGAPLPDDGLFHARETLFFLLTGGIVLVSAIAALALLWLLEPRLEAVWLPLAGTLQVGVLAATAAAFLWMGAIALVLRSGRNWVPGALAERGLVPWLLPKLETAARLAGVSRDRAGNAALRVFNRLSSARAKAGVAPKELLVLLPRCLGKESMRSAMSVAESYGVPMFVAARGRYARQMIAMRRPKAIIAVACERDLVSGVHDVAKHLPVLGTTLQLSDGPCRNTTFSPAELEGQVRRMLGLDATA